MLSWVKFFSWTREEVGGKEELARLKCAFNEGEGYRILLVPHSNKRCRRVVFFIASSREKRERATYRRPDPFIITTGLKSPVRNSSLLRVETSLQVQYSFWKYEWSKTKLRDLVISCRQSFWSSRVANIFDHHRVMFCREKDRWMKHTNNLTRDAVKDQSCLLKMCANWCMHRE